MRARGFLFTLNNPVAGSLDGLKGLKGVTYAIVGREVGESGTPHLQGYVYFKNAKTLSSVIKKIKKAGKKSAHVTIANGSASQNRTYCSKDEDFEEWGTLPKQGKRSDLTDCKAILDAGGCLKDIADKHFGDYVRYGRGFKDYKALLDKERTKDFRAVEVIFITGPTGCGKTRLAMEEASFKIQGDQLRWWDGYEGDKCILIDEYANNVNITQLLSLLDGYQLRLDIKGGFTYAAWTKVFITSNLLVLHDQARPEHREALERRITKTINHWPEPESVTGRKRKRYESLACDCFKFSP